MNSRSDPEQAMADALARALKNAANIRGATHCGRFTMPETRLQFPKQEKQEKQEKREAYIPLDARATRHHG